MSSFMKKIFLCLIGILAGLAAWPIAETVIYFQSKFPSYLILSVVLGGVFGLIMGMFFSTTEGIILQDKSKIFSGVFMGIIIGIIGGILGFLAAQFFMFFIGDKLSHSARSFDKFILPLSRGIGWAILGIFIAIVEGIRSGSFKKFLVGFIGGLLGGLIGGLCLEYLRFVIPNISISRLAGLLIFGFFIGLFYGFIEKSLSKGILRLLNGTLKGKEYLINQKKIKIGSSKKNDIILSDYENVEDNHAVLNIKKDDVILKNIGKKNPVLINESAVSEQVLKLEDVIKIGNAKFLFKFK